MGSLVRERESSETIVQCSEATGQQRSIAEEFATRSHVPSSYFPAGEPSMLVCAPCGLIVVGADLREYLSAPGEIGCSRELFSGAWGNSDDEKTRSNRIRSAACA